MEPLISPNEKILASRVLREAERDGKPTTADCRTALSTDES